MSEKPLNLFFQKLEKFHDFISNKSSDWNFEMLRKLEISLKKDEDLNDIHEKRFSEYRKHFKSKNFNFTDSKLHKIFVENENKLCSEYDHNYKNSKSAEINFLKARFNLYQISLKEFKPFAVNQKLFTWSGNEHSERESQILKLFHGLSGKNRLKISFIEKTASDNFVNLFDNGITTEKIVWKEDLYLMIKLFEYLATNYLELPQNLEQKAQLLQLKEIWESLNKKMISAFLDKNGNGLTAIQLNSNRSKSKNKQSEKLDCLYEILYDLM